MEMKVKNKRLKKRQSFKPPSMINREKETFTGLKRGEVETFLAHNQSKKSLRGGTESIVS